METPHLLTESLRRKIAKVKAENNYIFGRQAEFEIQIFFLHIFLCNMNTRDKYETLD